MVTKIDESNIKWYLENKIDNTEKAITDFFGTDITAVLKEMYDQGKIAIIEDLVFLNRFEVKQ